MFPSGCRNDITMGIIYTCISPLSFILFLFLFFVSNLESNLSSEPENRVSPSEYCKSASFLAPSSFPNCILILPTVSQLLESYFNMQQICMLKQHLIWFVKCITNTSWCNKPKMYNGWDAVKAAHFSLGWSSTGDPNWQQAVFQAATLPPSTQDVHACWSLQLVERKGSNIKCMVRRWVWALLGLAGWACFQVPLHKCETLVLELPQVLLCRWRTMTVLGHKAVVSQENQSDKAGQSPGLIN